MTTTPTLTQLQSQAMECLEEARSAGVALSEHVRSRGLHLRGIYDAIAQLRRRGIVPPAPKRVRKPVSTASTPVRFAKVEVRALSSASRLRPRLILANGRRVEFEIEDLAQLTRLVAALEATA